ncbi:exodeoxyribonuclease V subunit gamma [Alteromonas sp. C1M14]|uniref:exodeoxyribonuclease V subunit gamma n=1 Tax=Alteromonas sp. C1M14 TaxID=2841567 RepID=UPI001C0A0983|nr:exodeoxyribonuclease V subunit gamma [Alteromonas sp. C1M14]MBU2977149.1 exodeoxyribonuclease V subunit gamma [Alteromonas sp. C1M14]
MLALYPSNKLEHLSYLLATLLEQQPSQVFEPQTILVESPGMQHWLNMALARERGVAMNLHYPLPVRFMWDTARRILGEERVPRQSPYRREVLVWRIDGIIQSDTFCEQQLAEPVCRYWQDKGDENQASLQRLQFSTALADVYEQYLLYRPEWIFAWENHELVTDNRSDEAWQAFIWRELVKQNPDHPAKLHAETIARLSSATNAHLLPENIVVFAINTMAPQLVDFLDALSHHTHIHLFHLNPSVNYWGDVKSNKEQAKLLRTEGLSQWQNANQENPFLGNLGQQGRDLFNLLTPLSSYEIAAFDVEPPGEADNDVQLLHALQQDILHARAAEGHFTPQSDDNSVTVVSAHTPLREVEALHDHLLRLLEANHEEGLKPADIVVMCPAIENYAPFIDAVFQRVGAPKEDANETVRIPCSIADRAPLDAEPVIAAFMELLNLPDSRFEVSRIIDYLRLPPVQRKFGISEGDLDIISHWLEQAHVHWGRDKGHKAALIGQSVSETYTWAWGLKRLLLGMVLTDTPQINDGILTVPEVEGQHTVLLGRLMQLLEQLSTFASSLDEKRTATQWHQFLDEMRQGCFEPSQEDQGSWEAIARATADLVIHCEQAGYEHQLTLAQVRGILVRIFSTPDAANHFMTGQVTFCSMMPMRSIPFKVVCILGLNDGEFPRQSSPISLDLMAVSTRKQGDRSRRLEDRYLFLEALISARHYLYLSYQGNRSKDNKPRQPSLVLSELLDVLSASYGVKEPLVRTLPLHPFSPENYWGDWVGFDPGWFRLAKGLLHQETASSPLLSPVSADSKSGVLKVDALARAFDHPLKTFANEKLSVYLEQNQPVLSDAEPFGDNALLRYKVLKEFAGSNLQGADPSIIEQHFMLSGDLPDTPLTPQLLDTWSQGARALTDKFGTHMAKPHTISVDCNGLILEAQAWQGAEGLQLMLYGGDNNKQHLMQYLTLLCFNANGNALPLDTYFLKWTKGQFNVHCRHYEPFPTDVAQHLLMEICKLYQSFLTAPVPAFIDLTVSLLEAFAKWQKSHDDGLMFSQWLLSEDGQARWQSCLASSYMKIGLNEDAYVRWFFPNGLDVSHFPSQPLCHVFEPLLLNKKDKKLK